MNLVERESELELLRTAIDNCAAGAAGTILVSGASGTGKTALLHSAMAWARSGEFVMLSAGAGSTEKGCTVLDQLLADIAHSPAVDGDFEPNRFTALCRELAGRKPVLLLVDDVDLADADALACVHRLARRGLPRICVVLSRCDSCDIGEWWSDLERQVTVRQIHVGPLTPEGIAGLGGSGAADATTWHELTGGNPLLVAALAADGGVPGAAVGRATLRHLHRGGLRLLAVARAVAVLDADSSVARVGALLDMDADHVGAALRRLSEAGVLADGLFRCAIGAAAVIEDMPAALTAGLRDRAARVLHGDGAAADAVARQVLAMPGAGGWTGPVLEDAAEQAIGQGRTEFAARCLTRAMAVTGDAKPVARIRMRLAECTWPTDPGVAARHLGPLTHACATRLLSGTQAATVSRYLWWHGRVDDAVTLLGQLADGTLPWDVDTPIALRVARTWLAASCPQYAEEIEQPPPRDTTSPWGLRLRAVSTLAAILTNGPSQELLTRAVRVLEVLDGRYDDTALVALTSLVHADRADTAAAWCADAPRHATFEAVRAEIAVRLGDLHTAIRSGYQALLLPASSWGVAIGEPLATVITATTATGRYAEAADLLRQPVPEAMFGTRFALPYLHARGTYQLAVGRPAAALPDFLACGELIRDWRVDQAALVPWRASAAQALLELNRPERARRLLSERPPEPGERSRALATRQLAACRPPADRMALLTDAVDLATAAKDNLTLARALGDLAAVNQELGDEGAARSMLRRAYSLALTCGAQPLCRRLRPSRRAPAGNGLTAAEGRVARLAARDYTNREIAQRLHITPSTVEQHLTRVFRKLDVRQRGELSAALRGRDEH